MHDFAFIDIETTGLDPAEHEILEVAVVRVSAPELTELERSFAKVRPKHIETATQEALEVNGYTPARWEYACELSLALDQVRPLLDDATPAGHNIHFDLGFLRAAFSSYGQEVPWFGHRTLDTMSMAWPLALSDLTTSVSLDAVCEHFGIPRPSPHCALDDALASLDVARMLIRRWERATRPAPSSSQVIAADRGGLP